MKRAEIIMTKHSVCTTMNQHIFATSSQQKVFYSFSIHCECYYYFFVYVHTFQIFSMETFSFRMATQLDFLLIFFSQIGKKKERTHVCHLQILQAFSASRYCARKAIFFKFVNIFIQYFSLIPSFLLDIFSLLFMYFVFSQLFIFHFLILLLDVSIII